VPEQCPDTANGGGSRYIPVCIPPHPHLKPTPYPMPYPICLAQEQYADVASDGGSFSGSPIGPYKLGKDEESVIVNEELAQQFGVNAVGTTVCREFGSDGVFYGVITAFRSGKGNGEFLHQVEYTDGDVEDMDAEEYIYAHALYLKEEGWNVEEAEADATASASNTKKKRKQESSRHLH
jgi:hypothetical protein